jgi:hypothetical protein
LGETAAPSLWTTRKYCPKTFILRFHGLLDEFLDIGLDRPAPDVVALGAQVQVVRHDLARQPAILVQKLLANVGSFSSLVNIVVNKSGQFDAIMAAVAESPKDLSENHLTAPKSRR